MAQASILLSQVAPTAMQLQHSDHQVIVDRPKEKGGNGLGLMGGQYLLLGIGGCFCSTLFAAAQARDIEIRGLQVQVTGTMSEDLPKRFKDIALLTSYKSCSAPSEFDKLLTIAEKGCLSINTMKQGAEVKIVHSINVS